MNSDSRQSSEGHLARSLLQVLGTGAVLALFLVRLRWVAAGWPWRDLTIAKAGALIGAPYYDLLYVSAVTAGFAGALVLTRGHPRVQRLIVRLSVVVALLSLIMAHVNVKALRELGTPLTYQWLYYSDFLRGIDVYNAMQGLVTVKWLKGVVLQCGWLLLGCYVAIRSLRWATRRVSFAWLATPVVAGFCVAVVAGHAWLPRGASKRAKLQNPVVRLIRSALQTEENPLLTTMPTSVPPTDFEPLGVRAPSEGPLGAALRDQARRAGVQNVLIIVLESVGAQHLGAYGSPYGVTPQLDRYSRQGRIFTRMYASVPSTLHSLSALLLAIYHPHSFRVLTGEYPRLRVASLSGELERRGYHTAFFNGSDNRFHREDIFLQARQFDRLEDHRTFGCPAEVFSAPDKYFGYLDGAPDDCAVNRVAAWVADRARGPFFGMFWTMQTHYPYFLKEEPKAFGSGDAALDRYLNALHETDRALGKLLAVLEERGVLDSTLVVVVGDHGESFGQRGHYVHGIDLYEEEVHVPAILINRRLFHGETDSTIGGLIDVAPTILDLLGQSLPASWQGRSLFDSGRPGRTYLFTSHSRLLFGFRDETYKFIYDAGTNTRELYDLRTDPEERHNVAGRSPETVRLGEQRVAAWVQYERRYFRDLLVPDAR